MLTTSGTMPPWKHNAMLRSLPGARCDARPEGVSEQVCASLPPGCGVHERRGICRRG